MPAIDDVVRVYKALKKALEEEEDEAAGAAAKEAKRLYTDGSNIQNKKKTSEVLKFLHKILDKAGYIKKDGTLNYIDSTGGRRQSRRRQSRRRQTRRHR
jgi:NADH:ubiquinone oxidoreductase subunit E